MNKIITVLYAKEFNCFRVKTITGKKVRTQSFPCSKGLMTCSEQEVAAVARREFFNSSFRPRPTFNFIYKEIGWRF